MAHTLQPVEARFHEIVEVSDIVFKLQTFKLNLDNLVILNYFISHSRPFFDLSLSYFPVFTINYGIQW